MPLKCWPSTSKERRWRPTLLLAVVVVVAVLLLLLLLLLLLAPTPRQVPPSPPPEGVGVARAEVVLVVVVVPCDEEAPSRGAESERLKSSSHWPSGCYLPRVARAPPASANQRSASGIGVFTPCGAVSTRGTTVFVPVWNYLMSGDGTLVSPGGAGTTNPSRSTISRWGWGFYTVRGGIDPGDRRFRPRFVGVVELWQGVWSGAGTRPGWRWLHEPQPISDKLMGLKF